MAGFGVYFFEEGSKYEGEWKDNNAHGKGFYHYANGDVYEGGYLFESPDSLSN